MRQRDARISTAAALALAVGLGAMAAAAPARADTITQIDISSAYTGYWSTEFNGSALQAGAESGTGNTGTGLSFSDTTGQFVAVSGSTAITFGDVALTSNSTVQALFNQFFGDTGATITFYNSKAASFAVSLVSNVTIREYIDDSKGTNNLLSGTGTNVTAEPWWTTGDGSKNPDGQPSYRLDAQIFTLPAAWAGTSLNAIEIDNHGDGSTVLSALNVDAGSPINAVPEPMTLAILAPALLGLIVIRRRAAMDS